MEQLQVRITKAKKSCLLAKEVQISSKNKDLTSKIGGIFWGKKDEEWPCFDDKPLVAVLSILTQELPLVPPIFGDSALINVFVAEGQDQLSEENGTVVIRNYNSVDGLVPLKKPKQFLNFQKQPCFLIKWEETSDFQCYYQLKETLNSAELEAYNTQADELEEALPNHDGIKIGGWPTMVQETHFLKFDVPDFAFQIDENEVFSFCDSGIGYFFYSKEKGWSSHWETM